MSHSISNIFSHNANWKTAIAAPLAVVAGLGLAGCEDAADVASRNLSKAADNFEIQRDVVFYNAMTSHFFATVEGRCSIEVDAPKDKLDVTCKHGPDDFRKHFLGRAAGVTYFVLQTQPADVSEYNTRITFNPQGFIPDIDFRGNAQELINPSRPEPQPETAEPQAKPYTVQPGQPQQVQPQQALPLLQPR